MQPGSGAVMTRATAWCSRAPHPTAKTVTWPAPSPGSPVSTVTWAAARRWHSPRCPPVPHHHRDGHRHAGATATAAIELAVRAAVGVTVELIVDNPTRAPARAATGRSPVRAAAGWASRSTTAAATPSAGPRPGRQRRVPGVCLVDLPRQSQHRGALLHPPRGVTDSTVVNQRDSSLGGKWVLLGSYYFSAGGGQYIEVSSENGQASADAVGPHPAAGHGQPRTGARDQFARGQQQLRRGRQHHPGRQRQRCGRRQPERRYRVVSNSMARWAPVPGLPPPCPRACTSSARASPTAAAKLPATR